MLWLSNDYDFKLDLNQVMTCLAWLWIFILFMYLFFLYVDLVVAWDFKVATFDFLMTCRPASGVCIWKPTSVLFTFVLWLCLLSLQSSRVWRAVGGKKKKKKSMSGLLRFPWLNNYSNPHHNPVVFFFFSISSHFNRWAHEWLEGAVTKTVGHGRFVIAPH